MTKSYVVSLLLAGAVLIVAPQISVARAQDVRLNGEVFLEVDSDLNIVAVGPTKPTATAQDGKVFAFLDNRGHLYALDLALNSDGTLLNSAPTFLLDLSRRLADLTEFTTPLLGFMPAESATEDVAAGDLVVGLNDGGFKSLVTVVKRDHITAEIECALWMTQ